MADYVRFILVCEARTGSTMLMNALRSSPAIQCFGEVFSLRVPYIHYVTYGYDRNSEEDIALRARSPVQFLHERIYCEHPKAIRAVGFKLTNDWGLQGMLLEELLDHLRNDTELRVIHLKRRNLVRLLVSLKMAEHTGLWFEGDPTTVISSKLTARNALRALRHPRWAATRLLQLWRPPARPKQASIKITANELSTFLDETQRRTADFDELFSRRSMLTVHYEDLARDRQRVFDEVQTFLGLKPARLTTTLRKQNPEPLSELIENYDELYATFKSSPYEPFFD